MIICCGEALIDMVPVLSNSGQTSYAPLVGGAIFNTAIGLGRLGIEVGMVFQKTIDVHLCGGIQPAKTVIQKL